MEDVLGKWVAYEKTPGDSQVVDDDEGVFAVHGTLLPSGKVMWFSGHVESTHYITDAIEWDPLHAVDYGNPSWKPSRTAGTNPTIRKHPVPLDIDIFCCHLSHLPDGRILLVGGSTRVNYWGPTRVRNDLGEFDYVMYDSPNTEASRGIRDILIFDPNLPFDDGCIKKVGEMVEARWYPTVVTLPDGNIAVFSGWTDEQNVGLGSPIAETVEIIEVNKIDHLAPYYTPKVLNILEPDTDAENGAFINRFLPIYPGMHLSNNGKIYSTCTAWRYESTVRDGVGAAAGDRSNSFWAKRFPSSLDVDTKHCVGKWKILSGIAPNREEGSSIPVHPISDGKILVVGGNDMNGSHSIPYSGNTISAPLIESRYAEFIESSSDTVNPNIFLMRHPRINLNPVLLPDETILIIGGHNSYKWHTGAHQKTCEAYNPNDVVGKVEYLINQAYESDPAYIADSAAYLADTNNYSPFKEVAVLNDGRTYHSNAMLLTDGSVIVAGGVDPDQTEELPDGTPIGPLNLKTLEIYRPPYFYIAGTRPQIEEVDGVDLDLIENMKLDHGSSFVITTPQSADIDNVILMKLGSMTHHTDSDQRSVNVTFSSSSPTELSCTVPTDPKELPPGHYMLWIRDGELPCEKAAIIQIKTSTSANEPTGSNLIDMSTIEEEVFTHTRDSDSFDVKIKTSQKFILELLIDNVDIPLIYFPAAKAWGAKGLVFGRFPSVKGLAKYLIDNRIV